MEDCYFKSNIVHLLTSDGGTIFYSLSILVCRFSLIEDLASTCQPIEVIPVVITTEELTLLLFALDTYRCPDNDEDWISLLRAADYLGLKESHSGIMLHTLDAYLLKTKNVLFWTEEVKFQDYIKKIRDPTYLNAAEQKLIAERNVMEMKLDELKVTLKSLYRDPNSDLIDMSEMFSEKNALKEKLREKPFRRIRFG